MQRRTLITGATGAIALAGLGRITSASAQESTPSGETREITHVQGTTTIPVNPQRIVALGEEYLLADLLELGIKPAASSGNFLEEYVGIDPALTEGLTPFTLWDADLEAILELNADLILVPGIYWDVDPAMFQTISEMAPTVVLPSTDVWQDDFRFLASIFGLEELAETKITELDADIAATREALALDGETATFVTVYAGGTDLTLWLTPGIEAVEIATALGVTIVPDPADYEPDRVGRVYLSLERARDITGETVIMLQTTGGIIAEEEEALEEVLSSEIFQTLPAVQNDRVFVLERVGFPGEITGRRNLLTAFTDIFGPGSATPVAG